MIRYSRLALVAIGICIALAAGVLAWGLGGQKRLWTLLLVPLGFLAAGSSARISAPGSDLLRATGTMGIEGFPTEVKEYLGALNLLSLGGITLGLLAALSGVVFFFVKPTRRAGKARLVPAVAVAVSLGLVVVAYGYSQLPTGRLSNLLTVSHDTTAALVPLRFSQAMALEILVTVMLLQYAVVVVNYWQASAVAQLVGEYSLALGNRFSWRGPVLLVLLILACAKVLFVVYGFSERLPRALGGSAIYWYNGGSNVVLSAVWTTIVLAPVVFVSIGKIRAGLAEGVDVFKQGLIASLAIALVVTHSSALESASLILDEIVSTVRSPTFDSPLYDEHPYLSGTWAAAIMCSLATLILWRRKPGTAAVCMMGAAVLFLNVLHWAFSPIPFVGLAAIDFAVSFVFAFVVAAAILGRRQVPGWAIAAWLGITVLTHLSGVIPSGVQMRTFEFALVASLAYTFVWRAGELNAVLEKQPNHVVNILAFSALLSLISLVGIRGGDRFGRESNPVVNLWQVTSDSANLIVTPLLVLILVVATTRPKSRASSAILRHSNA
jgi:hypothetical protein